MQNLTDYDDLLSHLIDFFQRRLDTLYNRSISDVIIDPGFCFAKNLQQNYLLLRNIHTLQILHAPILVGLSRKTMIYKALDCTPDEALNGTTVLNTLALTEGANILRVHDVKQAKEAIRLYELYNGMNPDNMLCRP